MALSEDPGGGGNGGRSFEAWKQRLREGAVAPRASSKKAPPLPLGRVLEKMVSWSELMNALEERVKCGAGVDAVAPPLVPPTGRAPLSLQNLDAVIEVETRPR